MFHIQETQIALKKEMCGAGFFIQRLVDAWNTLPQVVVEANALIAFKNFLDRHMDL